MSTIDVFDASNPDDVNAAVDLTRKALLSYNDAIAAAQDESDEEERGPLHLTPNPALYGIDPAVYRQVEVATNAGKVHIMLYGPPGTGKTELAKYIAGQVATDYSLVTGSSDWTSQDIIGGYQPMGDGKIQFIPGIMLRRFAAPFIIDELNRCDIDKVLGPLFTVLSGHASTLPYREDVRDPDSAQYEILGTYQADAQPPRFCPGPRWRLIATINTVDKASLYQMSYALSRRFAWVLVDVPDSLPNFIAEFLQKARQKHIEPGAALPLAQLWSASNSLRPLGPAPFINIIDYCLQHDPDFDFQGEVDDEMSQVYIDAFKVNVMPMLDGKLESELDDLANAISDALNASHANREMLSRQMKLIAL